VVTNNEAGNNVEPESSDKGQEPIQEKPDRIGAIVAKIQKNQENMRVIAEMRPSALSFYRLLESLANRAKERDAMNDRFRRRDKLVWLSSIGSDYTKLMDKIDKASEFDDTGSCNPFIANTGFGWVAGFKGGRSGSSGTILGNPRYGEHSVIGPKASEIGKDLFDKDFQRGYELVTTMPDVFLRSVNVIAALNKKDEIKERKELENKKKKKER